MSIRLPAIVAVFMLLSSIAGRAQLFPGHVYDGQRYDSAVISFADNPASYSPTSFTVALDTSHTQLWRRGTTSKAFFSTGISGRPGIMTDTAAAYPVAANEWFSIRVGLISTTVLNPIVSFTHKYQTTSGKDGGVVEYSFDSLNWNNVVGGCYMNVPADSFYTAADTIRGNVPAFTGVSAWKRSRFQLFQGIPIKSASSCPLQFPFWVRFRFVSDSAADSLAGWIIRDVTVEHDIYHGAVGNLSRLPSLRVYPNPSGSGQWYWPRLEAEEQYILRITDGTGRTVYHGKYVRCLDARAWPAGRYYYHAGNGLAEYSGILQKD